MRLDPLVPSVVVQPRLNEQFTPRHNERTTNNEQQQITIKTSDYQNASNKQRPDNTERSQTAKWTDDKVG